MPLAINNELKPFLKWFQTNRGFIDISVLDFADFPASEGGRGAIAIEDIPVGHTLFTIPRSLTLSTRTSHLPSIFGEEQWKKMKLGEGWMVCISCNSSDKIRHADVLGRTGFIRADGYIIEKLGRADAEQCYQEKLLPAIKSRPDLFPPEMIPTHYSVAMYHIMGSRILSRSFNVERWDSGEGEEENLAPNTSHGTDMDVDNHGGDGNIDEPHHAETEGEGEDEDDAEDDPSDVAMVPMADLLNARYGSENAKLFYEEDELKMVSTKPIKAGEQIWNTYGDLPNSELLRRYGHVDLLPLPQGGEGNPGDVVEVRADIIVDSIIRQYQTLSSEASQERIDWWLEEGGDDVFVLDSDLELPPALVSLTRLLLLSGEEWEKLKAKGNPPKPKVDAQVLAIARDVLTVRVGAYPTSISDDDKLLSGPITHNQRHAIIVRIGEKRLLHGMVQRIGAIEAKVMQGNGQNKRKSREDTNEALSNKKSKK